MNYIDIKKASELTGKSERTIRRLLLKEDTKPFIKRVNNKLLVEVNYLLTIYPVKRQRENVQSQKQDMGTQQGLDMEILGLKHELELIKEQLNFKNELLEEKEKRITDLQKSLQLLEAPKEEKTKEKKKWLFFSNN